MKLKDTCAEKSFDYGWLLSRIFPFIKPFMGRIILGFIIAIPVGALDGIVAFALKPFMDYVVGQKDLVVHGYSISYSVLATLIPFGIVFFAVFQGVLRYLNDYLTDWTSQKITNSVKAELFSKLVYMDTKFFDVNKSGIVLSRYLTDPDIASKGIVENLKVITASAFGALSLIAVMLYSSWELALIGVLVLCIAFVPVGLIRKKIKSVSNKNMLISGNIMTNFNETYSGNRVMAAYKLQERQNKKFKDQIDESFAVSMSLVKRAAWMSPLMYFVSSIGIAIVLGFGTNLILLGKMTAGSFASFVTSLLLLYKPIRSLGGNLSGLQNIFVAMGRVFELFDFRPEIQNQNNAKKLTSFEQNVVFENVDFGYSEDIAVIKNFNLSVNKGETIAIVGNSGGGKSTLVNLIPRFYDVNVGAIKIDGTDVRELTLESLRDHISMVFQDNFLFSGTIKENILMGKPDATEQELNQAVCSANLQEMLAEMPNGIDTEIGERGSTLSGGQRQRVAIARAMIKGSPIIILDEATSALDNKSESIVQEAIDNLIQNKTVFVIAHRLSTIKNANRIAVINEGNLVELGTHDELMQIEQGQYKHLYEMQFAHSEQVLF